MSNRGLVSNWFTKGDFDAWSTFAELVRPGDLLEFDRGGYCHWVVYVGVLPSINDDIDDDDMIIYEHTIVHRANPTDAPNRATTFFSSSSSSLSKGNGTGDIISEPLNDVWPVNGRMRINNGLDTEMPPFETETEIVDRAFAFLRGEGGREGLMLRAYNVASNNCEHFATWTRNGWATSEQVARRMRQAVGVGAVLAIGVVARPFIALAGLSLLGVSAIQRVGNQRRASSREALTHED